MPNVSAFNPYRDWLGIQAAGPLTYYQLLGVTRQDSTEQIRLRATKLIQQLNRVDVEGRESQRDQLIGKIKRAATVLMDAEHRETYHRKLASKRSAKQKAAEQASKTAEVLPKPVPAPKPAPVKSAPTATVLKKSTTPTDPNANSARTTKPAKASQDEDSQSPPEKVTPANSQKLPAAESKDLLNAQTLDAQTVRHSGEKNVTDELMRLRPRRQNIAPAYVKQHRRSKVQTVSLILGALSLLGIGYLVASQTEWGQALAAKHLPTNAETSQQATGPNPVHAKESSVAPANTSGVARVDTEDGATARRDTVDTSTRMVEARTSNRFDNDPENQYSENQSMGDSGHSPELVIKNPHRREVMSLLKRARESLSKREVKRAKSMLEEARPYATDPTTQMMHGRLLTLTNYVDTYWKAADDLIDSFKAGNEAQIGDQRFMVVEKSKDQIILRIAGKNQMIDRKQLPTKLAVRLADTWFDEDVASTKVFRGAMMAVTPDFDPEVARELWRDAESTGEIRLGDLEQVLDDQYE